MQRGGQKDNLVLMNSDSIQLTTGEEVVLFLGFGQSEREGYTVENIPKWVPNPEETARRIQNLPLVLLTPWQAAYRVTSDARLESISPKNDLVLSMAILSRISEKNFLE
jgi:hypothetical protein